MQDSRQKISGAQLEALIKSAVDKIGGKKENDICRYIPSETGGYIHHFTMQKMKIEQPHRLQELISKYILNTNKPASVTPKKRAPRGSRKRRDVPLLSKHEIDLMIELANRAGAKDLIRKLTPRKDLRTVKRELISSIRHTHVEPDLWQAYADIVAHHNTPLPPHMQNTLHQSAAAFALMSH